MGRIRRNSMIFTICLTAIVTIAGGIFVYLFIKNSGQYNYAKMRLDANGILLELEENEGKFSQSIRSECDKKGFSLTAKGLSDKDTILYGTLARNMSFRQLGGDMNGHKGDIVYFVAPLLYGDAEQFGTLIVTAKASDYYERKDGTNFFVGLLVLFVLLVDTILFVRYFWSRKHVFVPVSQLHREIEYILKGDTDSPLRYDYDDEIGKLCHDVELLRGELDFEKKQSERMRENEKNLLACISHDMKTPLFAISSHIEAIRDGVVSEKDAVLSYANVILNRVQVMEKLIDDILEHSKSELQELSINVKSVFAQKYFSEVFQKVSQDFESHGKTLYISQIPECSVRIDSFRIQQVIFNIAANTLKYSDYQSDLYVGMEMIEMGQQSYLLINMRDEGRGISAADLPFIFERFYRGEKARSSDIPGSGLGLNISKYIIEKHGGRIECDSIVGKGTTISFSLPL